MHIHTVQKEAFEIVGVKWQGTYEQAGTGEIRHMMSQFRERVNEIPNAVDTGHLLGISVHDFSGGFTYYIGLAVKQVTQVPEGMTSLTVPAQLYATLIHPTGEEVFQSYQAVETWIQQQGYQAVTYPITHLEVYPASYQPLTDQPEFTIHIPIKEQS